MTDIERTSSLSPPPPLKHTLCQRGSSVLSIVTDDRHIYSGSQTADISVRLIMATSLCEI
jgi:hypothetical protein